MMNRSFCHAILRGVMLVAVFFVCFPGCSQEQEQSGCLSWMLVQLSSGLLAAGDCAAKEEVLLSWLDENARQLDACRVEFLEHVHDAGTPQWYRMMGIQLLSSGRVEAALSGCGGAGMAAQVLRLNRLAGTGISGGVQDKEPY